MRNISKKKKSKILALADIAEIFSLKTETLRYRIKNGMTIQEAVTVPLSIDLHNLTGKRFNRLFVDHKIKTSDTRNVMYHCICDCGNECDVFYCNLVSGKQQSCGCLNQDNRKNRAKNLSGQTINNIKIKHRVENEIDKNGRQHVRYLCECPLCGKDFVARIGNIKSGNTKSCGKHKASWNFIDLSGLDFEYCHVDKRAPDRIMPSGAKATMFECTCCCGRKYIDWAVRIRSETSNCGCKHIRSLGESIIYKLLTDFNIPFVDQFYFDDLRGEKNIPYYFDFALFDECENLLGLIEFQGEQHYHECKKSIKDFGKIQREISDPLKKQYCYNNNIQLFEIRYDEDIKTACENIINLLYHDNTVPSLQETV